MPDGFEQEYFWNGSSNKIVQTPVVPFTKDGSDTKPPGLYLKCSHILSPKSLINGQFMFNLKGHFILFTSMF